jgi:hypothetical protein
LRTALLLLLGSSICACSSASPACDDARVVSCSYFDVAAGVWSPSPPSSISLASACGPGGANGEIDAYVTPSSSYTLDRVGFVASGTAVRTGTLRASDDAGGTSYACGRPAARVITQLFCGRETGAGTLELAFTFSGRWGDGTPWTQRCDARLEVRP